MGHEDMPSAVQVRKSLLLWHQVGVDVVIAVDVRLGKPQLRDSTRALVLPVIVRRLTQHLGQFSQSELTPDYVYRIVVERLVLPLEDLLVVLRYLLSSLLHLLHQALGIFQKPFEASCQVLLGVNTLHTLLDDERLC